MHDVIVVGGGASGLATAYFLRDLGLDIQVLEASPEVGGRTKSVHLAGDAANTGAMFIYRNTKAEELAKELQIRTAAFSPTTYGLHIHGRTVVAENDDDLVAGLPLPELSKVALREFMRSVVDDYTAFTAGGQIAEAASTLESVSVAEHFSHLDADTRLILETAVRGGAVGDVAQLSAKYALRYFASYIAREKNNRLYPVDGMQEIPRSMARALPEGTVRLNTTVTDVRPDPSGEFFNVDVTAGGKTATLAARQIVLALPAPVVAKVCKGLPGWKTEVLDKAHTPGSTTLSIAADATGLPELKKWAFVTTVGRKFDAIINPAPGDAPFRTNSDTVHFVCYGNSAGYQPGFTDNQEEIERWVEDFLAVAPALSGRILGVHGQTWEHCFAVLTPQRPELLPDLQRPVGNLHFVGDYSSATAGTHGAYDEAQRVADAIRASLQLGGPGVSGAGRSDIP